MPEVLFSYSPYWIIPILLLAFSASYFYYFRKNSYTKAQAWLLAGLRFFALVLLGLLLLQPHFSAEDYREEKPIVVFLNDESASVYATEDSLQRRARLQELSELQNSLAEKYLIRSFNFAKNFSDTSVDPQETNLGEALNQLQGRFYQENLAAVVLSSDGIFNRGLSPQTTNFKNFAPIYTIALGDSSSKLDLALSSVLYNKTMLKGRSQNISVNLNAKNFNGNSLLLKLLDAKGNTVSQASYTVNSDNWFDKHIFKIEAKKSGLESYQLELEPQEGEQNTSNNRKSFAIEVIDSKERILIIAAQSHPDIAAINRSLTKDENYEVLYSSNESAKLDSVDLIIAFRPSEKLFNNIYNSGIPLWLFADPQTKMKDWGFWPALKTLLPEGEDTYVDLNSNFALFPVSMEEKELWSKLPPLDGFYGRLEAPIGFSALFHKRIADITTSSPVFTLGEEQGRRIALTLGMGIWRWRVYAYKQMREFETFDALMHKISQYLLSQTRSEGLKIEVPQENFANTVINWRATLFDASGNLVNDPEIKLTLVSEQGKEFSYSFQRRLKDYALQIKGLEEGKYRYQAETRLNDKLYSQRGEIFIEMNRLEMQNLQAQPAVLRALANRSGGRFFQENEISALKESLLELNSPILSFPVLNTRSIFSTWQLFFVALGFLAIEWLLRKYWGKL